MADIRAGVEAKTAVEELLAKSFPHYETFGQNYPEDSDGTLDCVSMALTCAFNKQGTLLAVGCNDGRIVIWDFLTRGIAKVIGAHVHPVCSISWNRSGHKLLTASTDFVVSIWDVLTGECDRTFRFPSPVLKVQFHPRDSNQFLVCPMKHAAVLMTLEGAHKVVPLEDEINKVYFANDCAIQTDLNIAASFDRRGRYIYTGNARGKILVFSAETLDLKASFRVTTTTSSTTALKSIEFARRGNCFLVNSADRTIRVYESGEVLACGKDGEPEPIQKLQDLVNRSLWKKCCFSGDGEYIVAGSARQHSLYIWEKNSGNLVKFLLGTKGETLLDVVWHPVRPIIASVASGVVSIWAQNQVVGYFVGFSPQENWSAYAPDFKELDENVEYDERESEFDVEDEDKEVQETKGPYEEDTEVDITTVEPISAFLSSDEDDDDKHALLYLPISPEIEDVEDSHATEQQVTADDSTGDRKRSSMGSAKDLQASPKKRKTKVFDVDLPNAPTDEIHPMLTAKKPATEKQNRRGSGSTVAVSSKSSSKSSSGKGQKVDARPKHKAVEMLKENSI